MSPATYEHFERGITILNSSIATQETARGGSCGQFSPTETGTRYIRRFSIRIDAVALFGMPLYDSTAHPLVETYIQDIRADQKLYQVPVSDTYMLSRVDFGKGFFDKAYEPRTASKKGGWFKGSLAAITNLSKALGLDTRFTYNPLGFTQMMFLDPYGFDEQHYTFGYVRREFLGSVRTWVYDVSLPALRIQDRPARINPHRWGARPLPEVRTGKRVRIQGKMTRHRMSKTDYQAFARSMANRVKPGTISGRRADNLPVGEERHFYTCKACGQAVDMRDLGQVFHHEVPDHERLPEN